MHVALTTTPRAVDSSNVVLTNLYLGLNHSRGGLASMHNEYARSADWLYANEFVLGSGTAVA